MQRFVSPTENCCSTGASGLRSDGSRSDPPRSAALLARLGDGYGLNVNFLWFDLRNRRRLREAALFEQIFPEVEHPMKESSTKRIAAGAKKCAPAANL